MNPSMHGGNESNRLQMNDEAAAPNTFLSTLYLNEIGLNQEKILEYLYSLILICTTYIIFCALSSVGLGMVG